MKIPRNDARGFTLVELIVSTVVFVIFSAMLYSFYRSQVFAARGVEAQTNAKESTEIGLAFLASELRMAGSRPVEYATGCGSAVPTVAVMPSCKSFSWLTDAQANSITFQLDWRGNNAGSAPDGCPDDLNEVITYAYDATNRRIERTALGANPATAAVVENVPADGLLFRYYDWQGTQLTAPLTELARHRVNAIVVHVETEIPPPNPGSAPVTAEKTTTIFRRNPPC